MKVEKRYYQVQALEAIEQAEREGIRRPLIVHPTGTGKGVVMGGIAIQRADRGRTLVLVHREELANQFVEKLGWQAPELSTGIVKAELNNVHADVVVASVPTVSRDNRLARLLESQQFDGPFGTVIADEAHHAPAPSWTKVLRAMGSFNPYGPLTVGLTATPERDKGKTLGVWEKVVSYMSIREAIYGGFLVPILPAEVVETKANLNKVRRGSDGDLSGTDLGRALEEAGAIEQMADAVLEHASDRKGVAFLPTVDTAHHLAKALNARGIKAAALDGNTPSELRAAILAGLKDGSIQWVTNCAVLTEGFDEPSISCVLVGRPTKFHGLYVQMVGRGTRKHPSKQNLLVIDIVGASQRHDIIGVVDLGLDLDDPREKKPDDGEDHRALCPTCQSADCEYLHHRCQLCKRYLPKSIVSDGGHRHDNCQAGKAGKVDVFGSSRLRWLPVGDGWCLGAGQEVVVMAPIGTDTWRLAAYRGGKVEVLHDQLPSDWAMGIGEDRAKAFQKLVERDARWLRMQPTEQQLNRLVREGLPEAKLPMVKTRGDAADLITRISGRRAMKRLTT